MSSHSRRRRNQGRKSRGQFAQIPHAVIKQMQKKLTPQGYKLLIDLFEQFNGWNNGDLTPAWSVMQNKGWRSKATLNNARKNLINQGFIEETRLGTLRPRKCGLYAVTWLPIDECHGKLDVKPTNVASGLWNKKN